jgi:hypothetical protein
MDEKADASHGTHLTSNSVGISQLAVSDGSVGQVLSTDGSDTLSFITPAAGVNITSSATAPTSPSVGDQWFDISSGILSTYMTDGTDSDWLDVSSANGLAAASSSMGGTITTHMIPDANDAYDIGSAEYKIRDLYVSDSSLWVGDDHKITTSGGKQKTKKRKKGKTPKKVYDALIGSGKPFATEAALKVKFKVDIHDPSPSNTVDPDHADFQPLTHQWLHFAITNGMAGAITPENIFDDTDDFEEESAGGGAMVFVSKTTISSAVSSVSITGIDTTYDRYVIKIQAKLASASTFNVRYSQNNGSTFDSASNYDSMGDRNGGYLYYSQNAQGYLHVDSADWYIATLDLEPSVGWINGSTGGIRSGNRTANGHSSVIISHRTLTSFDALQFFAGSGNISSGIITLYGIKDS